MSFPLPFEAHSCQVGLSVIRYKVPPSWVPVSHEWGLSLLVEVFLALGRQV